MMKMKESIGKLSIYIVTKITLWQAIKLSIAGKGYIPIADAISKVIVARMNSKGVE